ncbi:MAG: class II aldolase/adducin family protein [Thermoflexales bacterium]|nr:class II aldolase/adducin family protein [Thermoflexales bacterium]MCS7323803.1 class II aldolase/adducin family protein [Thermoflexales bacterium]MCX7939003.1 class II aldolase/adducin family protein [Thermoflexales bacterium]MDW8053937.1 class II aldolase/adducin family protein [Anaerolineae bacterium]MDW8292479.1 class II aldolase/adducin family protein [Anaerolineae bacterium]
MAIEPPFPELDELLAMIGEVGHRLSEINASEGAAGNISIYIGWNVEVRRRFPNAERVALPVAVPELAGKTFIVTGSGRRLREIRDDPAANLAALVVDPDGEHAQLYTSPRRLFARVTTEFNTHLAVHRDQVVRTGTNFHAVVHAQPLHLTYLSHIPRYRNEQHLNRHLLRWQPEMIVHFPQGLRVVPFLLPGSAELMEATVRALHTHHLVVWSKHGVVARSEVSVKRPCDYIEYAEAAARYELMNLANGEIADALSVEEIRRIAQAFGVGQTVFE